MCRSITQTKKHKSTQVLPVLVFQCDYCRCWLCTDMYWCKVLHATSDSAEPSCHAMLTRRESGGKLPACLDLEVEDGQKSKQIHLPPRKDSHVVWIIEKKQYQNTFFLEKSIFYFWMRKFIKGSFSWNYISPCNNGVCFLSNLFTTLTCTQLGQFWWKVFTILTKFKTWTISERSSWWWGDSSLHHSHLLSANVPWPTS